jgi:hypothetical protein
MLGFHDDCSHAQSDPLSASQRLEPEDALRMRVASLKGVALPPCPVCAGPLRREVATALKRESRFAIFSCDGCRRSVVIRTERATNESSVGQYV